MRKSFPLKTLTILALGMFFLQATFSGASSNDDVLRTVFEKLKGKESGLKTITLNFTISLQQTASSESVRTSSEGWRSFSSRDYLWQMKGEKMKLERKGETQQESKTIASFDGEKFFRFIYYEELMQGQREVQSSKKYKPGDVVQVHIYGEPTPLPDAYVGDIYVPLGYLGLGINKEKIAALLEESKTSLVGKENIAGDLCYIIEVIKDEEFQTSKGAKTVFRWRWRLRIDPNLSWSILRRVDYAPDGRVVYTLEFEDFKSYAEGIFLPTKATSTLYFYDEVIKKNLPISKKKFVVNECKINQDIPDQVFSPQIPDGVLVWDARVDEVYVAGQKQPTDEDILYVAEAARSFRNGEMGLEEIEKNFGPQKGQRSYKNCGPNALLAICGILGVKTSSKEIAQLAGADEKGFTSMAGLKKAAEALGLKVEGLDITIDDLRKSNKLAIAFIPPNHYIVVVGFADDKVVLIDPPTILGVTPIFALDTLWDGRALLISKP
ncbi:hypothetical protein H5T88_05205 [bacterium]|nr:hypothetical protein [bacterium]